MVSVSARRTAANRLVMFHGTSSGPNGSRLRSILKHGLIPTAPKAWAEDPNAKQALQRSRVSYGGTYFAANPRVAFSSVLQAMGRGHASEKKQYPVIVTALIQPRAALPDEDDYTFKIDFAYHYATKVADHPPTDGYYYLALFLKGYPQKDIEEARTRFAESVAKMLESYGVKTDTPRLRRFTDPLFDAEVIRRVSTQKDDWYGFKGNVRGRALDYYKYDLNTPVVESELPVELQKPPAYEEGEAKFRAALDALIRATRRLAIGLETHAKDAPERYRHVLRVMEPVTFRGRNKITSVVSLPNYYSRDIGDTVNVVVHYGDPTPVVKYLESEGYMVSVVKSKSTVSTSAHKKLEYIGQCDRIRRNNPEGESFWQEAIANKQETTIEEFLGACDPSPLLDEGETLEEWAGPNCQFFESHVAGRPVWFLECAGFEFMFADQARPVSATAIYTDESGKFWGSQGAGAIFMAEDTGRILLQHRSEYVNEPGTWGVIGGAIDSGEDPKEAMEREVQEETGYHGPMKSELLYTFKSGKFQYHNFLVTVPHEFEPKHGWESQGHVWTTLDELPEPLHFGLKAALPSLRERLSPSVTSASSYRGSFMSMRHMKRSSMSATDRKLVASLRLGFEADALVSAAKVDDLKARNPEIADEIQLLNNGLAERRLEKHLPWGVKQLKDKQPVDDILKALDEFESLLRKKKAKKNGAIDPTTRQRETEPFLTGRERDIFFYKTLKELADKIESAKEAIEERDVEEISRAEALKKIRQEGVEYIYHGPDFLVARPLTKKASCHYGLGTKWCISDPEQEYFQRYSKENKYFYFLIDRSKDSSGLAKPDPNKPDAKVNDPWAKVAFVFQKNDPDFLQAWNTPDIQMPLPRVLNHYTKEYGRKIYDLIHLMYKNVESLPNTWQYELENSTDPKRLVEIFNDQVDNEDARLSIASNPNIPEEISVQLAKDPSVKVRKALFMAPYGGPRSVTSAVAKIMVNDEDTGVRELLAKLTDDADVLLQLALDSSPAVRYSLANRQKQYPEAVREEVARRLMSPEMTEDARHGVDVARALVWKTEDPQNQLRILQLYPDAADDLAGRTDNDEVLAAILSTGRLSSWRRNDVIRKLKLTPERVEQFLADPTMHLLLIGSEHATTELLDRIGSFSPRDHKVARALASSPKASPELLARLVVEHANDPQAQATAILNTVAENNNTSPETLRALAAKPNVYKTTIAKNLNTPSDVLDSLAATPAAMGYNLAVLVAKNPNTSLETLQAFLPKKENETAYAHGQRLAAVLENPKTTREMVEQIASIAVPDLGNDSSYVKTALAANPLASVERLRELARQSVYSYGPALASNPSTPADVLEAIFDRRKDEVRRQGSLLESLMKHPNFPLAILVEQAKNPGKMLGKIAREALKTRPDAPPPPKRGRKPKQPVMTPTEVSSHVQELTEVVHLLRMPTAVLLAMEEAAALLAE